MPAGAAAVTEVYVDLLFLINAGMDCLCLCLAARILHIRLSVGRLLLGSALGGAYAVLALFINTDALPVSTLIFDVGFCLVMCAVVFAKKGLSIWRFLTQCGLFLVTSMLLGGVMTALFELLNRAGVDEWLGSSQGGEDGFSSFLFAALVGVGGLVTLWGSRRIRRSGSIRACRVTVELDGRAVTLDGMVDSGNLLRDPIGGTCVIPVDNERARAILSPALCDALDRSVEGVPDLAALPEARRIRLIPTHTASGHGLLWAILPDHVTLAPAEGEAREVAALIAPTSLARASDADAVPIEALVPAELL